MNRKIKIDFKEIFILTDVIISITDHIAQIMMKKPINGMFFLYSLKDCERILSKKLISIKENNIKPKKITIKLRENEFYALYQYLHFNPLNSDEIKIFFGELDQIKVNQLENYK